MHQMDDKHQYYRNDNFKRPCKHNYQYSSSLNKRNQMDFSNQQSKSNTYSYFPAQPPIPLMSNKTIPSSTLFTAIPHERESWIRSVKKTKTNESTEQKTQYLETMLRMPQQQQQKTSMNSSTFDRIRFANDQIPTTMNTIENSNLDANSFHFIGDINSHDEICAIENFLFDNQLQSTTGRCSNQIIDCEPTLQTNSKASPWSGFLIDNCDDEVLTPLSPPSHPEPPIVPFSSTIAESVQRNQEDFNQQRVMLVNELDAAHAEQRKEFKRQKRLHKKLHKKKKLARNKLQEQQISKPDSITTVNNRNHQELSSDWIIEYDVTETNQISQLTDMIKKTSVATTDEDKIEKINIILRKIKKQQKELKKLRQHFMAMLDEEQRPNSTNTTGQNSHTTQDLLMKFLNQPITSGCWLCSGKTYTEVASQCNNVNEQ